MNNEELLKLAEAGDIEALHKLEENLRNRVGESKTETVETIQKKFPGTITANQWLKEHTDIEIKSLHVIPTDNNNFDITINYIQKENRSYIYQFFVEKDVMRPIKMRDESSVKAWKIRHVGWKPIHSVMYQSGRDRTLYVNMIIPIPLERIKETTITLAIMPYSEYQVVEHKELEERKKGLKAEKGNVIISIIVTVIFVIIATILLIAGLT